MMLFNVEDLLALPQLKQGKLPKHVTEINIKEAVLEVRDIMDYLLKIKSINLEFIFEGFQSFPSPNYTVNFDKQRFQQVFLNFLSNAVKFVRGPGNIQVLLFKVKKNSGNALHSLF